MPQKTEPQTNQQHRRPLGELSTASPLLTDPDKQRTDFDGLISTG